MYYYVGRSLFPISISIQFGALMSSFVISMKYGFYMGFVASLLSMVLSIYGWLSVVLLESDSGNQSSKMVDAFRYCFMLFIFSEVMFFFSVFWVYFDSCVSPTVELGIEWPPVGMIPINPFGLPLLNTLLLLSSGFFVTWAHYLMIVKMNMFWSLLISIIMACMFLIAQFVEYKNSSFSMGDGVFGSCFFFGTGFHGIHVMLGSLGLAWNLCRQWSSGFSVNQHLSFEFSIVYWHFVDVVWLFLYVIYYWWSY